MKTTTLYLATRLLIATLSTTGVGGLASAQDPAKVAPESVKVAFENHRVRVLEVRIPPGGKVPKHSHPQHLVYAFSDVKGRYFTPDGLATVAEVKPATIVWSEPLTHSSENIGANEIHALVIELKEAPRKKRCAR